MKYGMFLACWLIVSTAALAENWPSWRGPTGQGFCSESIPLTWSGTENVRWKIPLEHQGNSTPVIWGDQIFLTQANEGGSLRSLLCLARADGKLLWQNTVSYDQPERNWNSKWYCNASPCVDGERVVVSFGSAGVYCYDLEGKEVWRRADLGTWEHAYGNSSSPVIYRDMVIQWCGPNNAGKGRNFLLAVDKRTGKTVWESEQPGGSWGTPLITSIDGKDQMLLGIPKKLKGFDPLSGNELWSCDGLTDLVYTSTLFGNGVCVSMSGYGGAALAVKVGGSGDITSDRLWHHPKNTQRVGSGMIIGDHVYMVEENSVPHCYELQTGNELWQVEKRLSGTTWGSMVHSDGRLYILMRSGETVVLAAKPSYEILATNSLGPGEQTNSSLAVSNGDVFLRTFKHLYCIRQQK